MTDEWIPKNKKELMTEIEKEWKLLISVAEKLTDAQMTTPDEGGWSPKDNLAHLSEWMKALTGYHLDKRPSHEAMNLPEEVTKDWDMEVINPVLFKRNRDRSRTEVMDELKATYQRTWDKLNAMSWDELMAPRHANDPEKRPVVMWVLGDTTEHFLEHRETIERGIKANS
jgi:hypothetical protein